MSFSNAMSFWRNFRNPGQGARRSAGVHAFVVATLAAASLSAQPAQADNSRAAIQALLEKRVAAVREHNENAFIATVDPRATDTFKSEQRNRYLGLQSVPVQDYALTTTEIDSGDLAPGLRLDDKYANHTYMPETRETFRLGDYDQRPMRNVFWYTYVERDGEWFFGGMDDARSIGLDATPNIWDEGPVAVQSSTRVLVLSGRGQVERSKAVLAVAETAMTRFDRAWPLDWSGKIPIIIPESADQAARLLRTSTQVSNFSAFTSYTPTRDVDWQASPPRLFAQEENLAAQSVASQVDTIVHELAHAATADLAGPNTPTWMQEGLAEWIRLGKPTSVSLREGSTKRLPASEDFATRDAVRLSAAYNEATAAMAFLASVKGMNAPIRLIEEAGKRRSVVGSPSFNADQALHATTGWTTAEFVDAWQDQ